MSTGDNREALNELLALADQLLEEASEIRRQWAQLGEALGVETDAATEPQALDAEPAAPAGDEVIRLVALDMMLSGSSKDETREHLQEVFGERADDAVLDDVYDSPA